MEEAHARHVGRLGGEIPVCQTFPERHLVRLVEATEEARYGPGEIIVAAGEEATFACVILSGSARMVYGSTGGPEALTTVFRVLGRGDLFGLVPALDGKPYGAGLQTLTETRVLVVPRDTLRAELEAHPETARELLTQLAVVVRSAENWVLSLLD